MQAKEFSTFQDNQGWRCTKPTLHKVVKKQLLAAREIEKYKEQLMTYTKVYAKAQESLNQISSKEVKVLNEICATLVRVQGNCNNILEIVDTIEKSGT